MCVLDTEASLEHLTRGTAFHADAMLVVAEPYFKSLEAARRTADLARDLGIEQVALVANKIRDAQDLDLVHGFAEASGLTIVGAIPFDERMPAADRAAAAPLDHAPEAAAVVAIAALADRLMAGARI